MPGMIINITCFTHYYSAHGFKPNRIRPASIIRMISIQCLDDILAMNEIDAKQKQKIVKFRDEYVDKLMQHAKTIVSIVNQDDAKVAPSFKNHSITKEVVDYIATRYSGKKITVQQVLQFMHEFMLHKVEVYDTFETEHYED